MRTPAMSKNYLAYSSSHGVLEWNLYSAPTEVPGVLGIAGPIHILDGSTTTAHDLRGFMRGFYLMATGEFIAAASSKPFEVVLAVPGGNASRRADDAALAQQLAAQAADLSAAAQQALHLLGSAAGVDFMEMRAAQEPGATPSPTPSPGPADDHQPLSAPSRCSMMLKGTISDVAVDRQAALLRSVTSPSSLAMSRSASSAPYAAMGVAGVGRVLDQAGQAISHTVQRLAVDSHGVLRWLAPASQRVASTTGTGAAQPRSGSPSSHASPTPRQLTAGAGGMSLAEIEALSRRLFPSGRAAVLGPVLAATVRSLQAPGAVPWLNGDSVSTATSSQRGSSAPWGVSWLSAVLGGAQSPPAALPSLRSSPGTTAALLHAVMAPLQVAGEAVDQFMGWGAAATKTAATQPQQATLVGAVHSLTQATVAAGRLLEAGADGAEARQAFVQALAAAPPNALSALQSVMHDIEAGIEPMRVEIARQLSAMSPLSASTHDVTASAIASALQPPLPDEPRVWAKHAFETPEETGDSPPSAPRRLGEAGLLKVQHPALYAMNASIVTWNCDFEMHVTAAAAISDHERVIAKAVVFLIFSLGATITQLVVLVPALVRSASTANGVRVSLYTMAMQAALDAHLTLLAMLSLVIWESLFTPMAMLAFFKLIQFSVLEMRFMVVVHKAHNPSAYAEGWTQQQRALTSLYASFYMFLLLTMFALYYWASTALPVIIMLAYSFWVPQILFSAWRGTDDGLPQRYILATSASRLFMPLYFLGCPANFVVEAIVTADINMGFALALLAWMAVQVGVLLLQRRWGPRFFVPSVLLPQPYDYHREVCVQDGRVLPTAEFPDNPAEAARRAAQEDDGTEAGDGAGQGAEPPTRLAGAWRATGQYFTAVQRYWQAVGARFAEVRRRAAERQAGQGGYMRVQGSGGDVISGEPPTDHPGADMEAGGARGGERAVACVICMADVTFPQRRGEYMVTPCNHLFHTACLQQWLDQKLECPTCRYQLPSPPTGPAAGPVRAGEGAGEPEAGGEAADGEGE